MTFSMKIDGSSPRRRNSGSGLDRARRAPGSFSRKPDGPHHAANRLPNQPGRTDMTSRRTQSAALTLAVLALLCWILTFMAGHDVWHDSGRPDFSRLGATRTDLRALAFAFYSLPLCLAAQIVVMMVSARQAARPGGPAEIRQAQSGRPPSASA